MELQWREGKSNPVRSVVWQVVSGWKEGARPGPRGKERDEARLCLHFPFWLAL